MRGGVKSEIGYIMNMNLTSFCYVKQKWKAWGKMMIGVKGLSEWVRREAPGGRHSVKVK